MNRALFLDRDGVLLEDSGYLASPTAMRYLNGSLESLARLSTLNSLILLVTNQSGVARGLISPTVLDKIHERLLRDVGDAGGRLDGIYCCPHDPLEFCACRKPRPGLLLRASREWSIDLRTSVMVGDRESDVQAGRNAGTLTVRIGDAVDSMANASFPSLAAAVHWLQAAIPDHP